MITTHTKNQSLYIGKLPNGDIEIQDNNLYMAGNVSGQDMPNMNTKYVKRIAIIPATDIPKLISFLQSSI